MPKLPTYDRSVGLGGGATASYASDGAFTAPARAVERLGETLAGLGAKFQASRESAWLSRNRAEAVRDVQGEQFETVPDAEKAVGEYVAAASADAPSPKAGSLLSEWSSSYLAQLIPDVAKSQAASAIAARDADMQLAVQAHAELVSKDPSQLQPALTRLADDFEGARLWMDEPSRQLAYESATATVRSAFGNAILQNDPDQLYDLTQAEDSPFTPEERARFSGAADARIYEMEAAQTAAELSADGEIMADMIGQVVKGEVDIDWLEANRDLIGENSYYRALGEGVAAADRPDPIDPNWLEDAYALAVEDPQAGPFRAWDAYSEGMMSKDTLSVFWGMAQDATAPEGAARNQARRYLLSELGKEGDGRFSVMREFERFVQKNPDAGLVELQDHARKIAEPFRQSAARRAITSLPRPKYAPPAPKPDAANMEAARAATAQKLQKGEINAREAAREAGTIRRWLKALESFSD